MWKRPTRRKSKRQGGGSWECNSGTCLIYHYYSARYLSGILAVTANGYESTNEHERWRSGRVRIAAKLCGGLSGDRQLGFPCKRREWMMSRCGNRSGCPDETRECVARTVPFTRGVALFGNGGCAADSCSSLFLHLAYIMGDTWRTNRMILDLDTRFSSGSVSESYD